MLLVTRHSSLVTALVAPPFCLYPSWSP